MGVNLGDLSTALETRRTADFNFLDVPNPSSGLQPKAYFGTALEQQANKSRNSNLLTQLVDNLDRVGVEVPEDLRNVYDNVARMKTASDAEPKMPDARLAPEEFTRRSDDYLREHALWSSGVVAREKLFGLLQNACLDAVVQAFDQVLSNAADRFDPAAAEYSEYATTLQGASVSSLLDAAGHEDHAELVSAWHGRQRLRAELDAVVAAVRPAFTIRWMDTDGAAMTRLIATDVNSAAVHSSDGWREAGVYPAVLAQGGSLRMARSAAEYGQRRGSDPVVVLDDDDDLPEGVSVGVVEPEAPRGKRIKPVRA